MQWPFHCWIRWLWYFDQLCVFWPYTHICLQNLWGGRKAKTMCWAWTDAQFLWACPRLGLWGAACLLCPRGIVRHRGVKLAVVSLSKKEIGCGWWLLMSVNCYEIMSFTMFAFDDTRFPAPLVFKGMGNLRCVLWQLVRTEPTPLFSLLASSLAGCRPLHVSLSTDEASALAGKTWQDVLLFKEQNRNRSLLTGLQPTAGLRKYTSGELCYIR